MCLRYGIWMMYRLIWLMLHLLLLLLLKLLVLLQPDKLLKLLELQLIHFTRPVLLL